MKTTEAPIVIEAELNAPVSKVWDSITQLDLMIQWYFDNIPEFKAEVGFRTKFSVQNGDRTFTHCWHVVEADACSVIKYEWNYEEYEGDSIVSFELSGQGESTQLKLTHRATKDFVDDIPEFARESGLMGWDYLINDRLKSLVEG